MSLEFILHAAIRVDEDVFATAQKPKRHCDIICGLAKLKRPVSGEQGFMTSTGRFVDRFEAMNIAKEVGQIGREHKNKRLYSEDLW